MTKHWIGAAALLLIAPAGVGAEPQAAGSGKLVERPATTTINGTAVAHTAGTLALPARHDRADGPKIEIPFLRFRAVRSSGAEPVFLLAGGPGSSLIDRLETPRGMAELAFLREFADVVLFDQRGAGRSRPRPTCTEEERLPTDRAVTQADRAAVLRRLAAACRDRLTAAGADLAVYTTRANADDVDLLRKALGYSKISLVAGSYGSHLAIDYMRRYAPHVARAMLRGLEGPDHTWDMPSGILAAITRIAADAEADPALKGRIPPGGLIAALTEVRDRLAREPQTVTVGSERIVLGPDDVRAAAKLGANRSGEWPIFVIDLHRGDYTHLARHALDRRTVTLSDPMFYMMDCASGISDARAGQVDADPAAALLGDINLGYNATCETWNAPDLGADFRRDLESDIPVLMFQGTWDTSTPLENGAEVARGLRRVTFAEIGRAGHPTFDELYENWQPMRGVVRTFLTGGTPELPARITLPRVTFKPPSAAAATD